MADFTFFYAMEGIVIALFIAFALALVFVFYRQRSAPGPGAPEGELEIYGKEGTTHVTHEHFKGSAVDATEYFLSSAIVSDFKKYLKTQRNALLSTEGASTEEKKAIEEALKSPEKLAELLKDIDDLPLEKIIRVHIIRDGVLGKKHLLLQFGDTTRSLASYASHDKETHFTLTSGPVSNGVIFGALWTLTGDLDFPIEGFKIGFFPEGTVHVFLPDNSKKDDTEEDKSHGKLSIKFWLARITALMPTFVGSNRLIETLNQQLKDSEMAKKELARRGRETATERDKYLAIIQNYPTEGGPIKKEDLVGSTFDVIDACVIGGFSLGLGEVADLLQINALLGVAIGIFGSLIIVYYRTKRR